MNFNKKKVATLIVAFVMVWVGNVYLFKYNSLKEPLFIKSYADLQSGMPIRLHYLQNINDEYGAVIITFPEANKEFVQFNEYEWGRTRYYKMKEINIHFDNVEDVKRLTKGKEVKLTKANVQFGNGKSVVVNIGEVYLSPSVNETPLLQFNSGSQDSNYGGRTTTVAMSNGVIKGIKDRFSLKISDMVKLQLNDKVVTPSEFPVKFKIGDTITFQYDFKFKDENDIRSNYFYQLSRLIECEDLNGRQANEIVDLHYDPNIHEIDVKRLEKEEGNR